MHRLARWQVERAPYTARHDVDLWARIRHFDDSDVEGNARMNTRTHPPLFRRCDICDGWLNVGSIRTQRMRYDDCGGTCTGCMALVGNDPDAILSLAQSEDQWDRAIAARAILEAPCPTPTSVSAAEAWLDRLNNSSATPATAMEKAP
jgi:hypothetical protein